MPVATVFLKFLVVTVDEYGMNGSRLTRFVVFAWFSVLPLLSGCVALGVPSERFHDPADHGGLFGDFRRGPASKVPSLGQQLVAEGAILTPPVAGLACHDSGPIGDVYPMDLDPLTGTATPAEPPNVPWPRFHPVPTRPVFGGNPSGIKSFEPALR